VKTLQAESKRNKEESTRKQVTIDQLVTSENTMRSQLNEGARLYQDAVKKIQALETSASAANAHNARVVEEKSKGLRATVELEQKRAKLAEQAVTAATHQASAVARKLALVQNLNAELETQKANLKLDSDRIMVELLLRRTQVKDSQKERDAAVARAEQLEMEKTLLKDQVQELKAAASQIITLPIPAVATVDTTAFELQHSVTVNNLQLDIASLSSDLEEARAELKQSQKDLQEARFPWHGMVDKEGKAIAGDEGAVDAVKARIDSLERTITALEKDKADITLEREQLLSEKRMREMKELEIANRREMTKLQAQYLGREDIPECFLSPESSSPTFPTDSLDTADDKMEMEVEEGEVVESNKEEECDCGREATIVEMTLKSEKVFVETLRLAKVTQAAAEMKLEETPLKERSIRLRTVAVVSKYRNMVEELVRDARVGMEDRLD
jgi:DNA repair exonuclease SbcCD ATPase subunit